MSTSQQATSMSADGHRPDATADAVSDGARILCSHTNARPFLAQHTRTVAYFLRFASLLILIILPNSKGSPAHAQAARCQLALPSCSFPWRRPRRSSRKLLRKTVLLTELASTARSTGPVVSLVAPTHCDRLVLSTPMCSKSTGQSTRTVLASKLVPTAIHRCGLCARRTARTVDVSAR